jgi:hypothetical protein
MNKFEFPENHELQGKLIEGQLANESKREERGVMGRFWGGSTEKPGNIAGFVVLVFAIMFACVLVWGNDTASLSKKDSLAIIGGFITLALGFIFGRSSS